MSRAAGIEARTPVTARLAATRRCSEVSFAEEPGVDTSPSESDATSTWPAAASFPAFFAARLAASSAFLRSFSAFLSTTATGSSVTGLSIGKAALATRCSGPRSRRRQKKNFTTLAQH